MGSVFSRNMDSSDERNSYTGISLMDIIPVEVLEIILLKLDYKSIINCRAVSKHLCSVISTPEFWHAVIQNSNMPIGDFSYPELWKKTEHWSWKYFTVLVKHQPFHRNLIINGNGQLNKPNPSDSDQVMDRKQFLRPGKKGESDYIVPCYKKLVKNSTNLLVGY